MVKKSMLAVEHAQVVIEHIQESHKSRLQKEYDLIEVFNRPG